MKKADIDALIKKGKVKLRGRELDIVKNTNTPLCRGCVFELGINCPETAVDICTRGNVLHYKDTNK